MTNGINSINGINGIFDKQIGLKKTDFKSTENFTDVLNNALNQVVNDVKSADDLSNKLATGDVKDLHQVMIAMEKADLGVQLTVQVRNKIVEAYQEIMRMQV